MNSYQKFLLYCSLLAESPGVFSTQDSKGLPVRISHKLLKKNVPLSVAFTHRDTEDFVKKLEYAAANSKYLNENSLDFGLTPIDLNLLPDEVFARDVADGVEEELSEIDEEMGEASEMTQNETVKISQVSLMHHGTYEPDPQLNPLIDGFVLNVKSDLEQRQMDPLFFTVHARGIVRHVADNKKTGRNSANQSATDETTRNTNDKTKDALGGGALEGLLQLSRFGNAESRRDENVKLVRSHYFFGPLKIDLVFETTRGLRVVNSTLSALAAHALLEISSADNSTVTFREFIIDNPMEYEIRLEGTKNRRLRNLSQSAVSRLFKRNGRMEIRLLRSFRRAASKPIRDITKQNNDTRQEETPRRKNDQQPNRKLREEIRP